MIACDVDSKYKFIEFPTGFEITGRERHLVKVELQDYCFVTSNRNNRAFGLYQYYDLSAKIAADLMSGWEPQKRDKEEHVPTWVKPWAVKQTAKAIGKRVHAQWKRLLGMVDPTVLNVQRAVFAATRGTSYSLLDSRLYRDSWLVHDITHYRAAAIAVRYAKAMVYAAPENRTKSLSTFLKSSPHAVALEELARTLGITIDITANPRELISDSWNDIDCVSALQNWRGLFSPTGAEYHSLNRTLMNLPGGVPSFMIAANLARIELPRPITSRIELDFVLSFIHRNCQASNLNLAVYATKDQIVEGMGRVNRYTHNRLSPRRARDIGLYARFINDYPDRHTGNLIGLTDKAIWWHRTQREREIDETINRLGVDNQAKRPPIDLPAKPEIKFLDTVKAICEEGARMENCVASYSEAAINGRCYLFHIEYGDETATIEVDRAGNVVQAYGPRDRLNKAAEWGKRILNRWGKDFPESVASPDELGIDPWVEAEPF